MRDRKPQNCSYSGENEKKIASLRSNPIPSREIYIYISVYLLVGHLMSHAINEQDIVDG
jgi:hypothetical protein